jgi:transcription elongation GreA/GreB family factor
LGSKVRLRYLDRGQETYQFTIVKEHSLPERGLVNQSAPLAKAVLDAEAGDEIEILLGSLIRKAVVESVA